MGVAAAFARDAADRAERLASLGSDLARHRASALARRVDAFPATASSVLRAHDEADARVRAAVTARLAAMDAELVRLAVAYRGALVAERDAEVATHAEGARRALLRVRDAAEATLAATRRRADEAARDAAGSSPAAALAAALAAEAEAEAALRNAEAEVAEAEAEASLRRREEEKKRVRTPRPRGDDDAREARFQKSADSEKHHHHPRLRGLSPPADEVGPSSAALLESLVSREIRACGDAVREIEDDAARRLAAGARSRVRKSPRGGGRREEDSPRRARNHATVPRRRRPVEDVFSLRIVYAPRAREERSRVARDGGARGGCGIGRMSSRVGHYESVVHMIKK